MTVIKLERQYLRHEPARFDWSVCGLAAGAVTMAVLTIVGAVDVARAIVAWLS